MKIQKQNKNGRKFKGFEISDTKLMELPCLGPWVKTLGQLREMLVHLNLMTSDCHEVSTLRMRSRNHQVQILIEWNRWEHDILIRSNCIGQLSSSGQSCHEWTGHLRTGSLDPHYQFHCVQACQLNLLTKLENILSAFEGLKCNWFSTSSRMLPARPACKALLQCWRSWIISSFP